MINFCNLPSLLNHGNLVFALLLFLIGMKHLGKNKCHAKSMSVTLVLSAITPAELAAHLPLGG